MLDYIIQTYNLKIVRLVQISFRILKINYRNNKSAFQCHLMKNKTFI